MQWSIKYQGVNCTNYTINHIIINRVNKMCIAGIALCNCCNRVQCIWCEESARYCNACYHMNTHDQLHCLQAMHLWSLKMIRLVWYSNEARLKWKWKHIKVKTRGRCLLGNFNWLMRSCERIRSITLLFIHVPMIAIIVSTHPLLRNKSFLHA